MRGPEDRMRKRDADAGSVKRPEAVDPQNGEVADCKESEEEKKELLTLKAGGKKRERQRHDRHHPGIAGNNESHEGDRFVEACRHVGQQPDRQEF